MPNYAFDLTVGDSDLTTTQYETAVERLEEFFGPDVAVEHWEQGGRWYSRVVACIWAPNIVAAMERWTDRLRRARETLRLPEHATVGISVALRDVSYPDVAVPRERWSRASNRGG